MNINIIKLNKFSCSLSKIKYKYLERINNNEKTRISWLPRKWLRLKHIIDREINKKYLKLLSLIKSTIEKIEIKYKNRKKSLPKYSWAIGTAFQNKAHINDPRCGYSYLGNVDKFSKPMFWKKFNALLYQWNFPSHPKSGFEII